MKYSFSSIFLVFFLFFFFSCEKTEKIDDFTIANPTLVLNCEFSENSRFIFNVSRSLSVLDNADLKIIEDAKIHLYKNGILIDSIFHANYHNMTYRSSLKPEHGNTYRVIVSHSLYPTITSTLEKLPSSINLSGFQFQLTDSAPNFYNPNYTISGDLSFIIHDQASEENYYDFNILYVDSVYDPDDSTFAGVMGRGLLWDLESDDPLIEKSTQIRELDIGTFYGHSTLHIGDELFDGNDYLFSLHFSAEEGRRMYIRHYYLVAKSLSPSDYHYNNTLQTFIESNYDPFSQPVHVFNNIENGYGIFAGFDSIMVPFCRRTHNMDWYEK